MARLKPTTRRKVENIASELRIAADDIEPARPFLAVLYRNLSRALESSMTVPDAPFSMRLPSGASIETELNADDESVGSVVIYPENFDPAKYYKRLVRGMSQ